MVYASWLRDTESIIVASSVVDFALILATLVFGFVCWKEQSLRFFFNIWKLRKFPANEGGIIWVHSVLRLVSLVLLTSGSSKDLRSHCPSGSRSRLAYIGVDGNSHCWWQCQSAEIITGGKQILTHVIILGFERLCDTLTRKFSATYWNCSSVCRLCGCHHQPGHVACLGNKASHLTALLVLMYVNCDKYQPMCVIGEFNYFLL